MEQYPSINVYKDLMGRVAFPPAVSILLPFHRVFSSRAELEQRLKIVLENVRHRLQKNYTPEAAFAVMDRLDKLRLQIRYETGHKSIALFASQDESRLCYLDTPVEEKIVIGDTFAVRELVADNKRLRGFLVLLLSDKECRFYLDSEGKLERVKTSVSAEVFAYVNEKPQRVANFSDPGERKEIVMDKFLHLMDQELSRVLATHPVPVFVVGPEKVLGHFRLHSRHLAQIAGYVHGNYMEAGEQELRQLVQPCLDSWQTQNRQALLSLMETAAGHKRLSEGITECWAAESHNNGRLLVIEKHFSFPARRGDTPDLIFGNDAPEDDPQGIPDAVDALIGRVMSQGGDVEFVDDGVLQEYGHIALIRYY